VNPHAALTRYRVLANVVGVALLVLVLVGVPLKYLAHESAVVAVVGPTHGFLYIVYLLTALDLAVRTRLPVLLTLVMLLAGTVPFLSFIIERIVTRRLRARWAAADYRPSVEVSSSSVGRDSRPGGSP
jgi:integral membrane protein